MCGDAHNEHGYRRLLRREYNWVVHQSPATEGLLTQMGFGGDIVIGEDLHVCRLYTVESILIFTWSQKL